MKTCWITRNGLHPATRTGVEELPFCDDPAHEPLKAACGACGTGLGITNEPPPWSCELHL